MYLQEAMETRKHLRNIKEGVVIWCYPVFYQDRMKRLYLLSIDDNIRYFIDGKDIMSDGWEVSKEWYEVEDFRKRFPNGVLCKILNTNNVWETYPRVIINYEKDKEYRFIGGTFQAKEIAPIPKDKIPLIWTEEGLK